MGLPRALPSFPTATTTDCPLPPGWCWICARSMCRWNEDGPGTRTRIPITDRVTVVTASLPWDVDGWAFSKARPARWSPGAVPAGTRTVNATVDRLAAATVIEETAVVIHVPAPCAESARFA